MEKGIIAGDVCLAINIFIGLFISRLASTKSVNKKVRTLLNRLYT